MLSVESVSKSFQWEGGQERTVLSSLSFSVKPGEFLAITGPSGAGKSTLLNILCGFDEPSSGRVALNGQAIHEMKDEDRARFRNESFGFIFQTPHVIPSETVYENITLPFRYSSVRSGNEESVAIELLQKVGLSDHAGQLPTTLSGGELQRLVFARAMVNSPQVIFADEPTGSLDKQNSVQVLNMLKDAAEEGCIVVMVTHDELAVDYASTHYRLEKR